MSLAVAKQWERLGKNHFNTNSRLFYRLFLFLSENCARPSSSKHISFPHDTLSSLHFCGTCYPCMVILVLTTLHFKYPSCLLDCELLRGWGDVLFNLASTSHIAGTYYTLLMLFIFLSGKNILAKTPKYNLSTMPVITFLIRGITLKPFVGSFGILIVYFSWQQIFTTHLFSTLSLIEYWHLTFLVVYSLVLCFSESFF